MTTVLLADVGGTNTRVALARDGILDRATVQKFRNAEHGGLGEVLRSFCQSTGAPLFAACVAVAGPVHRGTGTLTNLNWTFDAASVARATGAGRVTILTALPAQGHALGHLDSSALTPVIRADATADASQTKLVIGVGTGFNIAPVFESAGGRVVAPAESGHANLAAVPGLDRGLIAHFEEKAGFASIEDVLSGRGLEAVYHWSGLGPEVGAVTGAQIMAGLADGSDPRAEAAVRIFTRTLGVVAGNLALTLLPFGGIFLIGGMSRAIAPYSERFGFAEAFASKGRFGPFMKGFSVSVIEDDFAALTGCAAHLDGLSKIQN